MGELASCLELKALFNRFFTEEPSDCSINLQL
jgi:hypothetical protein